MESTENQVVNTLKDLETRENKLFRLTTLCTLSIEESIIYKSTDISKIIKHHLKGFKIVNDGFELNEDEYLEMFIDIKNFTLGK